LISYRNIIYVDLLAIEFNINAIKQLNNDADICAVVKANAYGHGIIPIANKLVSLHVKWLAVESFNEGVKLRKAGIIKPDILILACNFIYRLADINKYNLTPVIYSVEVLQQLINSVKECTTFHLEIDTGMGRTGILPSELPEVALMLKKAKNRHLIKIEGSFSHFSCADDIESSYTKEQLTRFSAAINYLFEQDITPKIIHIDNSASVLVKNGNYSFIRPGLLIYGISPINNCDSNIVNLRPALSWRTKPLQIKSLNKGDSVSYGQIWTATKKSVVAILPIGYADGYVRLISKQGFVLVGNSKAPIIGNICMDFMMVDITGCINITTNSEVVLVGSQGEHTITLQNIACWAQTIPYEIMCNIGKRAKYVYLNGDNT